MQDPISVQRQTRGTLRTALGGGSHGGPREACVRAKQYRETDNAVDVRAAAPQDANEILQSMSHRDRPALGRRARPAVWAVALACLTSCSLLKLLPDTRTAAEHARDVVPRCSAFSEEAIGTVVAPSLVETVEPAYSYVSSGPADREARLRGAHIHLRPAPGVSRESLQRSLECHQAHVLLGTAPARDADPYFSPGVWLDIDADSEGDGFIVAVQTNDLDQAKDVLRRARLFRNLNH
jgi:hypothetical protein